MLEVRSTLSHQAQALFTDSVAKGFSNRFALVARGSYSIVTPVASATEAAARGWRTAARSGLFEASTRTEMVLVAQVVEFTS